MKMKIPIAVIVVIDKRPLLAGSALNSPGPGAAQLSPRFARKVIGAVCPPRAEHSCALGEGAFWRGCAMSVCIVRHHLAVGYD